MRDAFDWDREEVSSVCGRARYPKIGSFADRHAHRRLFRSDLARNLDRTAGKLLFVAGWYEGIR